MGEAASGDVGTARSKCWRDAVPPHPPVNVVVAVVLAMTVQDEVVGQVAAATAFRHVCQTLEGEGAVPACLVEPVGRVGLARCEWAKPTDLVADGDKPCVFIVWCLAVGGSRQHRLGDP